jgi:PAS domain S-box-containing protein
MNKNSERGPSLKQQNIELQKRLSEAEQNLEAIRSGNADAIVVHVDGGVKVFTIQGAETAYRIMVENVNEGALTIDHDGVILYVNERFCSIIGFPSSCLTGKLLEEYVCPGFKESYNLLLKKSATFVKVHQDLEILKKDQSAVPVYVSCAPLEILGRRDICIIVSDLTERRVAQQRLETLNRELESKVKERTKELEKLTQSLEEQVIHRTSQVRQLAKALSFAEQKERQRLSVILHEDLQQTLFSIKTRFDILTSELPDITQQAQIDISDLKKITARALEASKILALEFNPPVLKNEGLDAALKWLAHHMEKRYKLKVDVCIKDGFTIVPNEERVLLVQLVRELLHNVAKHAKTDRACVTAVCRENHLNIEVEDTGIGFDVREQMNGVINENHMGLFSIEEKLRLLGGTLGIQSTPGQGTKVTILFPFENKNMQLGVE